MARNSIASQDACGTRSSKAGSYPHLPHFLPSAKLHRAMRYGSLIIRNSNGPQFHRRSGYLWHSQLQARLLSAAAALLTIWPVVPRHAPVTSKLRRKPSPSRMPACTPACAPVAPTGKCPDGMRRRPEILPISSVLSSALMIYIHSNTYKTNQAHASYVCVAMQLPC